MVVHHKDNKLQNNFKESLDQVDLLKPKSFQFHRLAKSVFFGNEVINQLPIACNFDYYKSIVFDKGCYLGQETSARSFYTGGIIRRCPKENEHVFGQS